ncbi:hypothetical protein [Xenorhabdus anantnagensis]|uniref:Uncharacterized protein n=1 Tax=Xenorhabdus anantnagensis TaxID=3025875 RepID=A0ABT5LTW4_9GAMM|nr:hypothetical protein [Xenorhabdus anantnagensis]MDC9597213.1 hypothetical protein [Xenorhabdus anantnagensis]
MFDSAGVIRSLSFDVSALFPDGLSIAEADKNSVPEGINIYGDWQYRNGKIIPRAYTPEEL